VDALRATQPAQRRRYANTQAMATVDEGDEDALIAFAVDEWQPDVYSALDTDIKGSPDLKKLKNQIYQWKQRIRKNFDLDEANWDPRYAEFINAVRCVPPPPPLRRHTALSMNYERFAADIAEAVRRVKARQEELLARDVRFGRSVTVGSTGLRTSS
jgi:hypothetical protein